MTNGKAILMLMLAAATLTLFFAACSAASVVSETDGQYIRIILETRSDKAFAMGLEWNAEWKFEALGDGAIEEVSTHEYFDAAEKELAKKSSSDGKKIFVPDMPVPGGYVEFYFKGVKSGFVDLRVTCELPGSSPLAEAKFKIAVFSDLKTYVLESSENYDWGGL